MGLIDSFTATCKFQSAWDNKRLFKKILKSIEAQWVATCTPEESLWKQEVYGRLLGETSVGNATCIMTVTSFKNQAMDQEIKDTVTVTIDGALKGPAGELSPFIRAPFCKLRIEI